MIILKKRVILIAILAGSLVLLVLGIVFWIYVFFHPRNQVDVTVLNIPDTTEDVFFIVETDDGIEKMNWYACKLIPFEIEATDSEGIVDKPFRTAVFWKWGRRYGVLQRMADYSWQVDWYDPGDVAFIGRSWLFGQGAVNFDLRKGKTEQFSTERARGMGFNTIDPSRFRKMGRPVDRPPTVPDVEPEKPSRPKDKLLTTVSPGGRKAVCFKPWHPRAVSKGSDCRLGGELRRA